MATALNFTAPLKQDRQTWAALRQLEATFADRIQPPLKQALAESETVHFARVLIIDDKYLQVLTEFDGPSRDYAEFFHEKLGWLFRRLFSLVEGAPSWEELNDPNAFFEFTQRLNAKALGRSTDDDEDGDED